MKKRLLLAGLILLLGLPALAQTWPFPPINTRDDDVRNLGPRPGAVITVERPPIIAEFFGTARGLRLYVDGRDVTHESRIRNESISFYPDYDLDEGSHHAQVTGIAADGSRISSSWNFLIDAD